MVAMSSAQNLLAALPQSIGVVRSQYVELQSMLTAAGMQLVVCGEQEQEMGDSLAAGVRHAVRLHPQSIGFVIALGDMPYIQPQTIREIANRIAVGGGIVVPTYQGKRGHPVGFAARFAADLLALNGDQGARILFERYPAEVMRFECDDPGILLDIDTPADLSG